MIRIDSRDYPEEELIPTLEKALKTLFYMQQMARHQPAYAPLKSVTLATVVSGVRKRGLL